MRTTFVMLISFAGFAVWVGSTSVSAPASTSAPVIKTPWGEPDLQGIWTDESETALQRPAKYANQEFYTEAQRAELDKERATLLGRDKRAERGSEYDVSGAYSSIFNDPKKTGVRTSLIVDPPDGRLPALTPEYKQIAAADRAFRLSILQSTESCQQKLRECAGGKYDPTPSPRLAELPPRYNTGGMNRADGPEDMGLPDRCLSNNGGELPVFASDFGGIFRRVVQTPGGITMFYDIGQGQGFQREIVMNSPHLPAIFRQWQGDSRGHWEGNTLVIDVTNFSPKMDFQGSRDQLHLIERWTRTGPTTIEFRDTVEDPTVWTKPWTVVEELTKQSDQENKVYYEPRCNEGNYALPAMLRGARDAEAAFAQGRGPNPATINKVAGTENDEVNPLQ